MIEKRPFGTLADGTEVLCWTLTNAEGLQAEILDYGVTIRSIVVPGKNGGPVDVVLGYDTLEEYVTNDGCLGATIGRFANRIAGACFELNGKKYALCANDGANHIHGGKVGFDRVVWNSRQEGETVVFSRLSPHGEEGYPGNLQVSVTVSWQGNGLELRYHAETDQDTILNLTNHSYFNLNGHGSGDVHGHQMQINAETFHLGDATCLPTGDILPVEGTAMDFRTMHPIGDMVDADEPCVKLSRGYDSNYVISGTPAVVTVGDQTGIVMTTTTDQPGVQLYTANFTSPRLGKGGKEYTYRTGFCLETQHYPDCIHYPDWPTCILRAGEAFDSVTTYAFAVETR